MDSIQTILNKIGYTDLKDFGNEWRTKPLYRHSDNPTSLVIKKDSGLWYDFSERLGGNLTQLVQKTLKLGSFDDAKKILSENNIQGEIKNKKYTSFITMQKTFDRSMLHRLIKKNDYWNGRLISEDNISQFGGGITFNGRLTNRYVFPIFNEKNELVGFAGRLLVNNPDFPKWKLIGQKSQWLYPLNINKKDIVEEKSVILVESIGDMLALFECGIRNVLVLFGVELSEKMIEFFLKMDMKKIIIALNNDEENGFVGNTAAQEIQEKLSRYFDEEQIKVICPKFKDFNDWLINDKEGLIKFLNENKK